MLQENPLYKSDQKGEGKVMNGKLNKILPLTGLFCGSLVFSPVFADMNSDSTGTSSSSSNASYSEITPPAGFAAAQGIGFSVYADFIYCQATQANLGFAESGVYNTTTTPTLISQGQVYYPDFKFQPGFKVGVSADLGHDNWDLDLNYTWFNGSAHRRSVSQVPADSNLTTLFPTYTSLDPDQVLSKANGNWSFIYNLVNFDLGRNYYISQYLTLRPYFGLSGSWNHQGTLIHYYMYDESAPDASNFLSLNYTQQYWGVGFDTGLNTAWCFNENWSIYGDFSVMNLWSRYSTNQKEVAYDWDEVTATVDMLNPTVSYNTNGVQYGLQNVVDIEMGIRWGMRFDNDNMGFMIQVGWDQQVWINHAQYAAQASNLSVQGLDVKLKFDF